MTGRRTLMPPDAVWYLGETEVNAVTVSGVVWLDREIDVERLRELVRTRLVDRFPVLRQRVVRSSIPGMLPHWEDAPTFDVADHVAAVRCPAPGDMAALQALCSRQRSRLLDRDAPPWKLYVIQGFSGRRTAVHARFQHCIGDGWALVRLLLSLTDADRAGRRPSPSPSRTATPPDGGGLFHTVASAGALATAVPRLGAAAVLHPADTSHRVARAAEAVRWGARNLLFPPRPPVTALIGRPGGTKRMAWDPRPIPLDEVRAVGRPFDATVNDVLLAALSGAFHRHLLERGTPADDSLVVVPVGLRHPDEPLPVNLGNRVGLLPVLLPTGPMSTRDRLLEVKRRMDVLKSSPGPMVSWALLAATALATSRGELIIHRFNQAHSVGVVTNVPGPQRPMYIAGARVDGVLGWGGATGNLNLNWSFVSYAGGLYNGVITDAAITPHPERILADVHREMGLLRALREPGATAAGRVRATATTRTPPHRASAPAAAPPRARTTAARVARRGR